MPPRGRRGGRKVKTMLIYNTTYQVDSDQIEYFRIWLHEVLIPEVHTADMGLRNPRLRRVLSHREEGSQCFCLEWEVEDSAVLHRWHLTQGRHFEEELRKIFGEKVLAFSTLLEALDY